MIDIQYVRDNPDRVKEYSAQKGNKVDVDGLLEADELKRSLTREIEDKRQERNQLISVSKGERPSDEQIQKGRYVREEIEKLEAKLRENDEVFTELLNQIPNAPLGDVPVGASEDENVVVKTVGEKPIFDFPVKTHWEIGQAKDWIDKERAAKVAGSRFTYLKGDLVRLEFALWQFALERLTDEAVIEKLIKDNNLSLSVKAFIPVLPPAMANTAIYESTGRLNGADQTYKLAEDDLWLNASAEHTLAPMYHGEILDEKDLPIRYVGYTTAFRREAGTYGKDMEGILRLHQFNKLEMETFSTKDTSLDEHYLMIAAQEYLMAELGLPYQVVMKCTADIGKPNARGVDIDVWLPGQDKYRETHTADLITDFQTRGMATRVRRTDGAVEFAHTNDATAFSERPLIGIIENFQTAEGNVRVPEVLRKYLGNKEEI